MEESKIKGLYDYSKFGKLLQSRIGIFSEIPEKVEFITEFNKIDNENRMDNIYQFFDLIHPSNFPLMFLYHYSSCFQPLLTIYNIIWG